MRMLEWTLLAAVAVTAVVTVICCAAIVEVFSQLAELRAASNLDDEPMQLDEHLGLDGREFSVASLGLPREVSKFSEALVVFLHSRCGTCRAIADAFREGVPDRVWIVIPEDDIRRVSSFEALASSSRRVVADTSDGVAATLGMDVTPSVITLRYGVVEHAFGISTPKQVFGFIPSEGALGEEVIASVA
jgi:hypothetical protein